MIGLEGKSIIVTGGGSGIGRSTVLLLARSKCKVTIADLDGDKADEVLKEVEAAGGEAQAIAADVSVEEEVRGMVDAAVRRFGGLHGAANVAGYPPAGKQLHELTTAEWDKRHSVNLRGLFFCNKYEILSLLGVEGAAIVNVASTSAVVGFQNAAEYCASKAGVLGLTRGAAIDYATKGIRINAVLPGGTRTPMFAGALETDPGLEAALAAVHPMNRFGQPEEIAAMIRFLLSDEASFITGASYAVDGGHTAI
jgi:NAD(P)-dependent dehydrogenase (short-subunit alcohol dehydrogenase family)